MGLALEAWGHHLFSVLGSGWHLADRGTMLEDVPGPLTERGTQVAQALEGSGVTQKL